MTILNFVRCLIFTEHVNIKGYIHNQIYYIVEPCERPQEIKYPKKYAKFTVLSDKLYPNPEDVYTEIATMTFTPLGVFIVQKPNLQHMTREDFLILSREYNKHSLNSTSIDVFTQNYPHVNFTPFVELINKENAYISQIKTQFTSKYVCQCDIYSFIRILKIDDNISMIISIIIIVIIRLLSHKEFLKIPKI